jgi:uncharacterized protein (TIGR02246 family)
MLAALLARVEALEDERAVHDTLVRYGFAVDSDEADGMAALYAEDCEIDIDGTSFMHGRGQARGIVTSTIHQSLLPNCAHVMGPFVIQVDGPRAVATGYQTVFLDRDAQTRVWRQSYGRWELEKRDGRWQILRRTSRRVGHAEAQGLLSRGLPPPSDGTP